MTEKLYKLCEVLKDSGYGYISNIGGFPYAYKTDKFGEVISPEARFNIGRLLNSEEEALIRTKSHWHIDELLEQVK